MLMIGSGINQFLILLVGLYSARYLGPNYYGIISLASSLNIIFIFFINLGLHHYITREIARDITSSNYFYSGIIWLKLIVFIPLILFVYFFMSVLGYDTLIINVTILTTVSFVFNSFVYGFYAIIQAYNDMKFIAMGYVLTGILTFVGIAIAILLRTDIYAFVIVPILVNSLIMSLVLIIISMKFRIRIQGLLIIKDFIKIHLPKAIPFGITGLFVTFYMWSGSFWLSYFHNEDLVGYYNIAFKLVIATFIVSQGVNMTIYPALSNLYLHDKIATKRLFFNQLKILGILSIGICVILLFLSNTLIYYLLGNQYAKSIIILQILAFSVPFVFIRSSFERLLEVTENQLRVTFSYAIGSITNIILNIILIFYYETIGAAVALVATDFLILVVTYYQSQKIRLV